MFQLLLLQEMCLRLEGAVLHQISQPLIRLGGFDFRLDGDPEGLQRRELDNVWIFWGHCRPPPSTSSLPWGSGQTLRTGLATPPFG